MNFVVASLSSSSLHILLIIVLSQSYFVSGMEVCKSFYDHNDMYNKEVMCPRSCCGTCKNRYCCSSIFSSDRLDQTQCQVDVPISNIVFLVLLLICFCACCNKLHNRCKRRKLIATPPLGSPLSPQSLTVQNLNRQANSSPNDGVLIAVFTSSSAPPLPNSTAHYNCGTNLNRVEEESPPAYESIFK